MNIEKIRFGITEFDLVVGGIDLSDDGGKITFQNKGLSFNEVKSILKSNDEITQIGLSGKPDWSRSDLIYAGKLQNIEEYVIGISEDGITEIKAEVMIASFRTPDLAERVITLEIENVEIKKENAAIKESLGTLLVNELEVE